MCHILATLVGIAVVAVDYRLVPDHPIPAAIDDAAKALRWLSGNARELSIDPDRTAVGGDSGGGNLSSVLAIMARVDRFLLSFFRHWPIRLSIKRRKAPLMKRTRKGCRSPRIRWAGSFNCLSDDAVGLDWRTFPIPVASVAGLAPLLVITMGNDPLRDEGRDYAKILKSVGPCSNVLELH
ncbi:hypothetical protein GCM10010924_49510 [Rhizobium wenxiniae]|nr:hypothetical protein GCM10010924_49510 [Rhizobium wenxiniae]